MIKNFGPLLCSLLVLTLLTLSHAQPGKITIGSEDQLEFALKYMREGKFKQAVNEFERFLYFFPEDGRSPEIRYLIGECYLEGKSYEAARDTLLKLYTDYSSRPVAAKALFLVGESYRKQDVLDEAEYYYRKIIDEFQDRELKNAALYRIGWSRMQDRRWEEASEIFSRVEEGSSLYTLSLLLAERSLEGAQLPFKNPTVAGVMGAMMPGLGHAYSGRYKDGLVSFLLNGLSIWATIQSFNARLHALGVVLLFLELGWYTGNIYSAVNGAHKYNRNLKEDFLRNLPDDLSLSSISIGKRDPGPAPAS